MPSFARSWIKRLERNAQKSRAVLQMRDGSMRTFEDMEVFQEMFMARVDLMCGKQPSSHVLDAVRGATPQSRAAFEKKYGPTQMVAHITAANYQGGWVDEYRLLEDGTIETIRYEGGSKKAERIRQEVRQASPGPAS
jgi:hypothetical protein